MEENRQLGSLRRPTPPIEVADEKQQPLFGVGDEVASLIAKLPQRQPTEAEMAYRGMRALTG